MRPAISEALFWPLVTNPLKPRTLGWYRVFFKHEHDEQRLECSA
jgi:hypothetical protein